MINVGRELRPIIIQNIMKRIAHIIVLAFPFAVFAQNPYKPVIHNYTEVVTVDTAFLKVQYTMSFRGLNEKDSQLLTDTRIVLVGKTARKDYSYWIDKREEENHTRIASGKSPYLSTESVANPFDLIILSDGVVQVNQRTLGNGPILSYEENRPSLKWMLQPGDTTVLGYRCSAAELHYQGRSYYVWYAEDIPVSAGPYIFDGLPGLILKVICLDGDYLWEATGIENSNVPIIEKEYGDKTKRCTKQESDKIMEYAYKHPYQYALQFVRSIRVRDGSGKSRPAGEPEFAISYFYNPIELE